MCFYVLGCGTSLLKSWWSNAKCEHVVTKLFKCMLNECCRIFSVNCYALISGYVGVQGRHRLSNLIMLWLQVVFYNVIFTVLSQLHHHGTIGEKGILRALFPVSTRAYWYFTAYVGLFLLLPLINMAIRELKKEQLKQIVIGMIILFSLIPTIANEDVFGISGGFHLLWLMILYIIGAYIGKYSLFEKRSKWVWLIVYAISVLVAWGSTILNQYLDAHGGQQGIYSIELVSYTSPAIFLAAIALLMFFAKLKIGEKAAKGIRLISPLTFGVFLIHENYFVREQVILNRLADAVHLPVYELVFKVIALAGTIYIVCILIEFVRSMLFKWLRIRKVVDRVCARIEGE